MKMAMRILTVLAICGIIAGCNKTSRKVYDEKPGEKQTAGIGKSVYETEVIDIDAVYDIKEPQTVSATPAPKPAAPAAAPAATPAPAPKPAAGLGVPGAPAPKKETALAAAPAAPTPAPAPAPAVKKPAAPAASPAEAAAIKKTLKDFQASIEKKDKKRFLELVSYEQKDKALVDASYTCLTSFYELDNAMKKKFGEDMAAAVKKSSTGDMKTSLDAPLPNADMIDSATVTQDGNKAGVKVQGYPQTLELVKESNQWKLLIAPLMELEQVKDPKQMLTILKGLTAASKASLAALKANKSQKEIADTFSKQMLMTFFAASGMKPAPAPKTAPKATPEKPKTSAGGVSPEMLDKLKKLATSGKIDPQDVAKIAQMQAKLKSGQAPSPEDLQYINDLKKKYKL